MKEMIEKSTGMPSKIASITVVWMLLLLNLVWPTNSATLTNCQLYEFHKVIKTNGSINDCK